MVTGEIRRVSESGAWRTQHISWVQLRSETHCAAAQGSYLCRHHFGWWIVCVVCACSCARLTTVLPTRGAPPPLLHPGLPNETVNVRTVPSKLYSWEDEWLLSWPLPPPDNTLLQHPNHHFLFGRRRRAATSGQFKAATKSSCLCIGSEDKNAACVLHTG